MSDLNSEGAVLEIVPEIPQRPKVNTQLYENSRLAGSHVEQMVSELTNGLYGARKPNLAIEHEKPEHRLILLLKLKGLSNREISRQTNFTEPWISQITRQPWFQLMLVEALSNAQEEVIDQIVKMEATNSIFKLVQLRDTAKSEQVQLAASVDILNRHLGKPIQRTEVMGTVQHSLVRADQIDRELAEVEAEERRLLTNGMNGSTESRPPAGHTPTPSPSSTPVDPIVAELVSLP